MTSYSREMQQQLKDSLELLQMIFGPDLLGVYLFGSSLVGGLQKYSDIDLFVVTSHASTSEGKTTLIASLLHISGIYMNPMPLESLIRQNEDYENIRRHSQILELQFAP